MEGQALTKIRVGHGFDTHAFAGKGRLVLGGVEVPCARGGLAGHSDADVLTHAVASAMLGSLALGDLGTHFPDTDERFHGVSSLGLLQHVCGLIQERGYRLVNCDVTVVAQEPRLAPFIEDMRNNLAQVLEVSPEQISIKATTAEKMGALGRAEGIAAHAIVLVEQG